MIAQAAIAILGVLAIWLSQAASISSRRWAPILGLAGQPFWMYATFTAEQWGIFILSLFYTAAWARGVKNHWFGGTGA